MAAFVALDIREVFTSATRTRAASATRRTGRRDAAGSQRSSSDAQALATASRNAPSSLSGVDAKATVRRLMDEVVNGGREELIDELFTPERADWARDWFGSFRRSFPDLQMELVELVAEADTVVGRFACSATHLGDWRGHPPTGRRFEDVDEVYFFSFQGDRIAAVWGVEDSLDRFRQLRLDPDDT